MPTAGQFPLAVWELTSAGMLPWLAAALLPWLVHRLLQRPQRTTDWAAIDLLLAAMQRRSRQINLHQWLLLALRTVIILLIVIAAASPVYHRFAVGAQTSSRQHIVLVIDCSLSMSVESAGQSRLERAQQAAREIVISSAGKDAFTVIAWDRTAEKTLGEPTFNTKRILSAIDELQPSHSPADFLAALSAVDEVLDDANDAPGVSQPLVVFLSDRTQTTWDLDSKNVQRLEKLADQARLSLLDVDDNRRDNCAVVDLRIEPTLLVQDRQLEIVATIQSFDTQDRQEVSVELVVEGRRTDGQLIELAAGQQAEVSFSHAFVDAGRQVVEASLAAIDDALPADDRRRLLVDVKPRLHIACIAGYKGAAAEVARALKPAGEQQPLSPFVPEVIPLGRLAELPFREYDAIFLCSVDQLSRRESQRLSHYVRQGGSLTLLLGNSKIGSELSSLLPVSIDSELAVGEFRFDPLDYRHPIVHPFRGRSSAGLLSTTINRYIRITPKSADTAIESALAFDSGDPALVVRNVGQGRVAVLALPAALRFADAQARPWSSFPVSPSFLPIVRELSSYLVGDNWLEQHNPQVGELAELPPNNSAGGPLQLLSPSGESNPLFAPPNEPLQFIADESGVYSLQDGTRKLPLAAANLDPCESDLRVVSGEVLPAEFSTIEQMPAAKTNQRWGGTSLVGSVLTLSFILLLLESTLAWWLGRSWG